VAIPAALQQLVTGVDGDGLVRVHLDGAGRVVGVRPAPDAGSLDDAVLSAAVLAAANDAVRRRLAAWSAAVAPSAGGAEEWALLAARGFTDLRFARELNAFVTTAVDRLRALTAVPASGTVVGRSREQGVTVTAEGGWVSAVDIGAGTPDVEAQLREALDGALAGGSPLTGLAGLAGLAGRVGAQRDLVRELGTAN
jgi:hypothetical protein